MKTTLFIGWGDLAKKYYLPYLRKFFSPSAAPEHVGYVAEEPTVAQSVRSLCVYPWGARELDNAITQGAFDHFFVLTPPRLHMKQLKAILRLIPTGKETWIFIEKPLGSPIDDVRETVKLVKQHCPTRMDRIRCIDHYTQKWSVDCFQKNITYQTGWSFAPIGELQKIVFASFEKQDMWSSEAFAGGYAREHAPHAIAMIRRLAPVFSDPHTKIDVATGTPVGSWRYRGCSPTCPSESSFLLRFEVTNPKWAGAIPLVVCGGKGLKRDVKKLLVRGDKASFVAHFNDDRAFVVEGLARTELDTPPDRPAAYEKIMSGIFGPNPNPSGVTISVDDALVALECIEDAVATLGKPPEHEKNTTPEELAEIERRIP